MRRRPGEVVDELLRQSALRLSGAPRPRQRGTYLVGCVQDGPVEPVDRGVVEGRGGPADLGEHGEQPGGLVGGLPGLGGEHVEQPVVRHLGDLDRGEGGAQRGPWRESRQGLEAVRRRRHSSNVCSNDWEFQQLNGHVGERLVALDERRRGGLGQHPVHEGGARPVGIRGRVAEGGPRRETWGRQQISSSGGPPSTVAPGSRRATGCRRPRWRSGAGGPRAARDGPVPHRARARRRRAVGAGVPRVDGLRAGRAGGPVRLLAGAHAVVHRRVGAERRLGGAGSPPARPGPARVRRAWIPDAA